MIYETLHRKRKIEQRKSHKMKIKQNEIPGFICLIALCFLNCLHLKENLKY